MISISHNIKEATRILPELSGGKIKMAARQAMNRVGITARKEAANALAEKINPRRKGDVRKRIALDKATAFRPVVFLHINDRPFGLDEVKATRVRSFRRGRRRVQKITYNGSVIKGAFRPKNLTKGDRAIFKQVPGKYATGNRKVKRLYAFSLIQELVKHDIDEVVNSTMSRRFPLEFKRMLANQIRRL